MTAHFARTQQQEMAPKVLMTGVTGYIGGTVLETLVNQPPDYEITALLRTVPEGFHDRYPNVSVVRGDYDSSDILADAASKADIVIHTGNSDHEHSLHSLIAGLLRTTSNSPSDHPKFLIHLSGTGLIADWLDETRVPGTLNPKIWSDIHDLDATTTRSERELHRRTHMIVQAAAADHGDRLKTAIVCPPDIYGPGRGPGRRVSALTPVFVREDEEAGAAFYVGEGRNTRSWVHVEDLMVVYLKLMEVAVGGGEGADWGREGYYFASLQEASQIEVAREVGKILHAHGVLEMAQPKALPSEYVRAMESPTDRPGLGMYLFGSNSRSRPHMAERRFGYTPSAPTLWESLESDVLTCIAK